MTERAKARKGRSGTAAERIVTAGLATATCIGVVGLLGTRMVSAQEATPEATAATESTPVLLASPASTVVTSSAGMTQSDLDAYAALLAAEKDRLDAYREELRTAAKAINAAANGRTAAVTVPKAPGKQATGPANASAAVPVIPVPAAKPAPAAKAPPVLAAPAPQTYTKGS